MSLILSYKEEILTGKRIYLKPLRESDVNEEYCSWLNDTDINRFLSTKRSSIQELEKYVHDRYDDPFCLFYGIYLKNDDKHIGNIKLEPIDAITQSAIVGILIGDKQSWRKGYCTEVMTLIVRFAFDDLNLKYLELGVDERNVDAVRCYQKAGFLKVSENAIPREKTGFWMRIYNQGQEPKDTPPDSPATQSGL